MTIEKVYSGIHPTAKQNIDMFFDDKEKLIIKRWAEQWYITSVGKRNVSNSDYMFALAKPTTTIEEALSISREIVLIFSPYDLLEARVLDAYDNITEELTEQRYEKICYALISADRNIEESLKNYVTNQENRIIVPFSYDSFEATRSDSNFIKNQFRRYFYSRDLFDYSEPLKQDTFFFGRTDIVTQIIAKHRNGLNYGLFGLRKTGKTSIIYDVNRKSSAQEFISIIIDCQNPSFNMRAWNKALYYIILELAKKTGYKEICNESMFTKENAATLFSELISKIRAYINKSILIMFDEIENITFGKSSVVHWCDELDFVYFWQSIRSAYQATNDVFTFCIFGTNAKCIEDAVILGKDNPIYNMFQPYYIPGFDYSQTREMIRKLGRIMGIKFDEGIYMRLVEDYGGHPFLMRRVCSKIAQQNQERPVLIDRNKYSSAKNEFNLENNYFEMILQVLKQFYPDEYEMLRLLACDDYETFNYFVQEDRSLVNHLVGYGLISENAGSYDFKIDAIKAFVLRIHSTHPAMTTPEEKWSHICTTRNSLEIELRKMVKSILKIIYKKESEAKAYIIKKVFSNDNKYRGKTYLELFDSRVSNIYLKNLTDLILANWDYFSDYFGKQDVFIANMNLLNSEGRFDAHATVPSDEEIVVVENAARYIRKGIDKYKTSLE